MAKGFAKAVLRSRRAFARGVRHLNTYGGLMTALATVAMAGFSWALVIYAGKQNEINSGQLALMQADLRPWIRPNIVGIDPLVISDKEITFGLTFTFVNVGKYPAYGVGYAFEMTSPNAKYFEGQDFQCKIAELDSVNDKQGATIFPNEQDGRTFALRASSGNLKDFYVPRGPYSKDPPFVIPVINGCIAYRDATNKFHHTWFSYRVTKAQSGFIGPEPQTIEAKDVRLGLGPFGRNTAD